ncbi:hypothetical protein H7J07_04655 [Mycobacterium koreense]|uniref:hypothetical protein n=1 Tax=Mycolicibacillus koreensis TaxID=1069220 RepID=UPI00138B5E9D|nr:hypothetical protein [Mycolicibacillus koreensis]MCV7247547.1 hypothetical protein [Mycolicibacillus koreensis]BBY53926.1 hypothetical protein MKOR_11770 [Mycolicibacillus koreensis]
MTDDDEVAEFLRDKEPTGEYSKCRYCGNETEILDWPSESELIAFCRSCNRYYKVG